MKDYLCVVAGIDFQSPSEAALRQAIRIAERAAAKLHVVHVIDTLVVTDLERSLAPEQRNLRDGLRRDAQKAWEAFSERIPGAERVSIEILINNRSVGLAQRANELRADLLVVGAYGSREPDVGPGTVATSCLRRCTADVLLVREGSSEPFRVVVAATDLSEPSRLAIAGAAQVAARDGADLHLLHVIESPWEALGFPSTTTLATRELRASIRQSAESALAELVSESQKAHPGLEIRGTVVDGGVARRAIPRHAQGVGADLLVLGARGRGGLRDLILGSTAEAALKRSTCSVLVVRGACPQGVIATFSTPSR